MIIIEFFNQSGFTEFKFEARIENSKNYEIFGTCTESRASDP